MLHATRAWCLLLLLALAGCATVPTEIERPRLELVDVEVRELGLLQQRYAIRLRAQNPNPIALPIQGITYSIALDGAQFASGVSSLPFRIPAYGESEVEIELSTSLLRTGQWLLDRFRTGDTAVTYQISGDIDVGLGRIGRIPFEEQGSVDLSLERTANER